MKWMMESISGNHVDTIGNSSAIIERPPETALLVPAPDPDLVILHKELALTRPLEISKGATAAGLDPEAARRELNKVAPELRIAFSKLKALSMGMKAKWWNLVGKLINKTLNVEVMPPSSESLSHFNEMTDFFRISATAVRCIDNGSSSVSFDAASSTGYKTGFPHFWGLVENGLETKRQRAQQGFRRAFPDIGVNGDANHHNRLIAKISHFLSSIQFDMLNIGGMPRVTNAVLLMIMNKSDHPEDLENHAGKTHAWIRDTGKTVGGGLKVRFLEVSFKGPFEGSSREKEARPWTVCSSLDFMRVNGFIRGNWITHGAEKPLAPKISGALQRNDRALHILLGRAVRIRWFGEYQAGGIKVGSEEESETSWDPDAMSAMIEGGCCVTPGVLQAVMDTAQEAYEQMVVPHVLRALNDELEVSEERDRTMVMDQPLLDVVSMDLGSMGQRRVLIADGPGDLKIGNIIMSSDEEPLNGGNIRVRSVLSEEKHADLLLRIADLDAESSFLRPATVV